MGMSSAKTMTVFPGTGPGKNCLWIRTAAGPDIGFGHLKRSLALAGLLSDCINPLFLLDSQDFGSRDLIAEGGREFLAMDINKAWDLLPEPVAVLIDTRLTSGLDILISRAQGKGIPVISLNDLGLYPIPSDIAIDGSIAPGQTADSRCLLYRGTEYMVLDPIYRRFHIEQKRIGKTIRSIFINLGGGNSQRFFSIIMEGLRLCEREFDVTGVRGFSSWGQESFGKRDWSPLHFRWESRAPESALFTADLAITAGGLSAYEALCTGTPLLALSYDRWQQMTVTALAREGACIDLGLGDNVVPDQLPAQIAFVGRNEDLRRRLSHRGKEIVDGRGAERVAQIIRKAIFDRALRCPGAC
jgi:spore coat polysaccharide biosynthesis predicted glycosyltransferase SpsG